jgi:pyruvate formate-lyase activating enzyme-like uncharacterized protein
MDNKYIITKVDDGIYYIDDFLSKEEIDVMMSECLDESGWSIGEGEWESNIKQCTASAKLRQEINNRLESIINNDQEESNSTTLVSRLRVSTGNGSDWALGVHADNHEYGDGRSVNVTKGYIIYFNENFEGGETVYLNKNIKLKPKAGRMLVHSAYKDYTHAVNHVLSGTRYFITGFVFKKGTLVKG